MKILQVGEFKRKFSEILDQIRQGEEITISFGKKKDKIAVLIPYLKHQKTHNRKLGILENKATFTFKTNFKMSDEELLNS